jgi:hypothetical protein
MIGPMLWPDRVSREVEADLKHLKRKAIKLIDAWVITEDSIRKLKERLKKLRKK